MYRKKKGTLHLCGSLQQQISKGLQRSVLLLGMEKQRHAAWKGRAESPWGPGSRAETHTL